MYCSTCCNDRLRPKLTFDNIMEFEILILGGPLNRGRLVRLGNFVRRSADEDLAVTRCGVWEDGGAQGYCKPIGYVATMWLHIWIRGSNER